MPFFTTDPIFKFKVGATQKLKLVCRTREKDPDADLFWKTNEFVICNTNGGPVGAKSGVCNNKDDRKIRRKNLGDLFLSHSER